MTRFSVRSLRRSIIFVLIFLFISGVTWWGVWTLAANEFRSSIDNWIDAGLANGYTITYDGRQMFGFPHHVVLRFANLNWKNTEGIAFHADNMDLSSVPWDRQIFDARFHKHAEIDAPLEAEGQMLVLSGDEGRAHVVLDPQGYWKFSHISLLRAKIGHAPGVTFQSDRLDATAERPEKLPKDHTEAGLTLTGHMENILIPSGMPEPFGDKITALDTTLRVMGAVPDFRRPVSVATWNNSSGVVEFDKLHMEWGSLKMDAKGTIGFDDDLQPEGAFASTIGNHGQVLEALMKQGFIPQRQATMLNSALDVFAKPASADSAIQVPITVQLNGIFLGPVRIFVFPEIDWPKPEMPLTNVGPSQMPPPTPADVAAVTSTTSAPPVASFTPSSLDRMIKPSSESAPPTVPPVVDTLAPPK